jgi:Raf kinase inhibitor-like YbhB/YbcL family protein
MTMIHKVTLLISITLGFALTGLASLPAAGQAQTTFTLTSVAFAPDGSIPAENSCTAGNKSPALAWSGAPAATKSFVLILQDPDAPHGLFTHWIAFDIPASATSLPAALPHTDSLPGGGEQGMNSAAKVGYLGPCPPPGKVHHYRFTLYALNSTINLPKGASIKAVQAAMEPDVIGNATLVGTFSR